MAVKMVHEVMFCAIVLCSMLLTVQTAPTSERRPLDALQVVPIGQEPFETLSSDASQHSRSKRAIIFRPLFVYRQQQIKKQHVLDGYNLPKSNPDKQDINNYAGQLPAGFFF
uniref:Uncharacterized protein n=1 Tax=Anopheles dirus TaxID=7168 RepID=A0A182NMC7_9DIPT